MFVIDMYLVCLLIVKSLQDKLYEKEMWGKTKDEDQKNTKTNRWMMSKQK